MNHFAAGAFHPALTEGRATGRISVTKTAVLFRTLSSSELPSETGEVELPLDGLSLAWGGANNALLFLTHSAAPEWRIYCRESALLRELEATGDASIVSQVALLKKHRHGVRFFTGAVLGMVVLLVLSVVALRGPITAGIAKLIPVPAEEQVGSVLFNAAKLSLPLIEEQETVALLNELTAPLVPVLQESGFTPKVFLAKEKELNAFAMPGGYVVLYSAVVLEAESPEEVLGVLAHEFAHVTERHVLRGIISSLGLYAFFDLVIGGGAGTLAALGNLAPELLRLGYSRELERSADERGMEYLHRAGIDGRGMVRFFKRLHEQEKMLGTTEVEKVFSFFRSHPTSDERMQYLEQLAGAPKEPRPEVQRSFEKLRAKLQEMTRGESSSS